MSLSVSQLLADRDQLFADWGVSLTFREVTQTYNPQTLQVSESTTDTTLTGIFGGVATERARETAGQHTETEVTVLIKVEEFPLPVPDNTSRIVYDGHEYHVLNFALSPEELVYSLTCQRI